MAPLHLFLGKKKIFKENRQYTALSLTQIIAR